MSVRIRDVVGSLAFLREVSNLALFFACMNLALGLVEIVIGQGNLDRLSNGIGVFVAGLILICLAVWMRRGSPIALWIFVGVLGLDVVAMLVLPMGAVPAWALGARVIVIVILFTLFQRRRKAMRG